MSIDRWMDKKYVVLIHIYNRVLFSHKKEWNNANCTNMDATTNYHTKWNKLGKERQTPIRSFICGI